MIYRISIHEMGHAIVGLLCNDHSKLVKVCLNLWSPSSPGYTIFEQPEIDSHLYTKERLMSRLKVLLSGRIAEEVFFGASITSGASKDIEEAYSLAERMIVKFGMGKKTVYPHNSENSKEYIDRDIERLLESAYQEAHNTIINSQSIMEESAKLLMNDKLLLPDDILKIIQRHHIDNL
jgi:cell division protease FtsH